MSDVPLWKCDFFQLKESGGPGLESLTVGSKFGLRCHGDIAVNWDQGLPHLAFKTPEEQYTLVILQSTQQDPTDVQYIVTAYKTGEHKPEYIRILQGAAGQEKGFEANGLTWTARSVIDPKQQQPQPYGPLGPWRLSLPLWFTITVVAALLVLAYVIFRRVRRHLQRRRMLEDLKRHQTALQPLHQFYRDARNLRRRMNAVKDGAELKAISADLDREFRLYVLRRFQIPTLDWSNGEILQDLRRRHQQTYRAGGEALKRTLRELTKLNSRSAIDLKDVEQMHRMSLDAAERLDGGHA